MCGLVVHPRTVLYFHVFLAVSTTHIQNKKFVLLNAPMIEYIRIMCVNRFRSLSSAAITIHVQARACSVTFVHLRAV